MNFVPLRCILAFDTYRGYFHVFIYLRKTYVCDNRFLNKFKKVVFVSSVLSINGIDFNVATESFTC